MNQATTQSNRVLPRILLTAGEPAGIGPDLCVLTAAKVWSCDLTVVGDPHLLSARASTLGAPVRIRLTFPDAPTCPHEAGVLKVWPVSGAADARCGHLDPNHAGYVLECLREATRACLAQNYDALVTGPVHKGIINDAGIPFSGHTEYLATLTGGHPVMMLVTKGLRVALVTTHLPLHAVPAAITPERLRTVVEVMYRDLIARFGIGEPRILVCGLNPHAGESGHLGREDVDIIEPVLEELRGQGLRVRGPLPADTLFLPKYLDRADAVLAMYHDQGLPVLKYAGFGRAVNITLGLPVIRTSVDHGTALDLAGTGRIDTGSMEAALQAAIDLALNRLSLGKETP